MRLFQNEKPSSRSGRENEKLSKILKDFTCIKGMLGKNIIFPYGKNKLTIMKSAKKGGLSWQGK